MAEILATMVVGPLVSMVKEKASSYLLEQYRVMEGMEEQHKVLKRKLPAILDVIADAEMQAAEHREGAKAWLEEVREVAYQANDVFDEFKYEALRRKAKKEGHYRKLGMHVIKLFPTHNRVVFRYRMGNKLRFILQAIEVLIAEMNAFRFEFRPHVQQQLPMDWRQTDSIIVDPTEIASKSRAADKQKVVEKLLGPKNNGHPTVLPIVGMGGLGKTTLAQLVYNDPGIRKHFPLFLWVCVSDNFDVDLLAKSIVEQAAGSQSDTKPPLDSLREAVSGKKYLLVLDDVWNREANRWERLKSSLQHGSVGSSVLTTTRDEEVAQVMSSTKGYKLGFLEQKFIEEIIKTKAFGSKDVSPADKRVEMVGEVAKRCAGSPLAATALGSVLRSKSSKKEWRAVLSRSTICNNETGILPILKLSYNALPSQMRQCFSFCAIFPKDFEIDRDLLIQLWMANGFILEEHPEIRGEQIFTELVSRSFFQDGKGISRIDDYDLSSDVRSSKFRYYSRITYKIHDLMHDVAQSAMGKECTTITAEQSKNENFSYSTRHLFVTHRHTILNGLLEKSAPGLQTLLSTLFGGTELQYLSKHNSIRALRIQEFSPLKPKYLRHLRYLNLSGSDSIEALPEDISILYHLQTLDVSGCRYLAELPKEMKYMTALRHLYTHGCQELKMMPPELRCLTSLQTLTCFVAGTTGSSCSNMGELGFLLDLGGQLEIRQLENVTETDALAAKLGDKKELTELSLIWTDTDREPQHHDKVLEGLKPHDGIKVLSVYNYGGRTYPTWMNTLHLVVELVLHGCNSVEKLPSLWRLPTLQFLYVNGMENLCCFCDGDPPFTFKKLKELHLYRMPNFETWWDINKVHGQDPIFPKVEKLSIEGCEKLTALPRAPAITESPASVGTVWRSACPELKELKLVSLATFQRWEAVEETPREQITTFPCLEKLNISSCPELTTLPEAPKMSVLQINQANQQIFLHAARYITSLSTLTFSMNDREAELQADLNLIKLVDDKEKWNCESSLRVLGLGRCNFLSPHSINPPVLWKCFVQLEDLCIMDYDALVHWPENVFGRLVSLRRLFIGRCHKLTGCIQASEQATPGRSVLPPRLESLRLWYCNSLVEVPTLPASLRELRINTCNGLESVIVQKQQNTRLQGSCSEATAVRNLSELNIQFCDNLRSLSVQLDCTELNIWECHRLESLDYLPSLLERLNLVDCKGLESIPDGPQAYSALRYLRIELCPGLKVLPPCLKQRLNDIEYLRLDPWHTADPKREWMTMLRKVPC